MKYLFILTLLMFGCTSNEVHPTKYYRLKITNSDGTVEYSQIIKNDK